MAIEITREKTVANTVKYVTKEEEFKGKVYIVIGKERENSKTGDVYTKGLWVNKEDFAKVAPLLVDAVKQYAPDALKLN